MGRPSLWVKKKSAVIRIGLISIFFITCMLVPAMKLLPFFEWTILVTNERKIELTKQTTTRVYFDGITRSTTQEYSFKELKRDISVYDIYPKLSGDYLEILSLSGVGMILLGTIIFGLKLGLNDWLWQSKKKIHSLIYHGSSMVVILVILIHWTLLIIAFGGTTPVPVYVPGSTTSFILPPTPNFILVFLMILGIVSLVVSDNFESILTFLKRT